MTPQLPAAQRTAKASIRSPFQEATAVTNDDDPGAYL